MHVIRLGNPSPELARHVRFYAQRQIDLGSETLTHPVPARATQALTFLFGDSHHVRTLQTGLVEKSPNAVLVGLQTHQRVQLLIRGSGEEFAIFFRPLGINQLFSMPVDELTNRDADAVALLGPPISHLRQRLGNCRCFEERVEMVEGFFSSRMADARRNGPRCGVEQASNAIAYSQGRSRVDILAQRTGWSVRQFERKFLQQVGLPPKLYSRIVRFESALDQGGGGSKVLDDSGARARISRPDAHDS